MTEAPARGVRLSRSARRAQLLVAARDVFAAQGYHAAAMDDIAERAGVSKPVLYQHFPGKLELYRALLTTCADDLVERVRDAIGRTSDNRERVRGGGVGLLRLRRRRRAGLPAGVRVGPAGRAGGGRGRRRCADPLHRDRRRRRSPPTPGSTRRRARLLAVGLVGLSQVTAQYWLDSEQEVPRDEAVALMASLAWRGLAGFPMVHERPPGS